jgi:CheY-like chemotaxis protein
MKEKPAKQAKAPARFSPEKASPMPTRGCLLVVEDHAPTRYGLQKLLTDRNFDVWGAASIAEAWSLIADIKFDLLVSDIGLPDGDGYMLMSELRDRYGLRGIALTGFDMEDDFKLSKEAGFSAHLIKPIQTKILDRALESLGI